MLKKSHQTFIGPKIIFNEDIENYDSEKEEILQNLGHRLYVNKVNISKENTGINVELKMENLGNAPIYTNVKTKILLYDENEKLINSFDVSSRYNIKNLYDLNEESISFNIYNINLTSGNTYNLCIALTDDSDNPIIEMAMKNEYKDKIYLLGSFKY